MRVDGLERALPRGECDVADGAQHDHAHDDGQQLQPKKFDPAKTPQKQGSRQGTTAQRDRALQPTWT